MEDRLKSHYESLSRAAGFTRSADTKAAPVLALQVLLVGTLAARFERLATILMKETWDVEAVILASLIVFYALFLVAAITFAARVYLPMNPKTGESLIYFEDIGAMPFESFQKQASQMDPETIEGQLLQQIHAVSLIASAKMHRVRWAYFLSAPSVVLWVILLVWGSI